MDAIIVMTERQVAEMIRQTAQAVADDLRADIEGGRVPELMNRAQLADYLGIHVGSVIRLIRAGMPYELVLSTPRFRKEDVDRWMRSRI